MQYISTRGEAPKLGFDDVLLAGLATDGGLYVPESWPQVDAETMRRWRALSYQELAVEVMLPFVEGSIPRADFVELVNRAYSTFQHSAVAPIKQLDTDLYLLELFHGPTLAFKDCALQLLGHLFDYVLERRNERVTIVGATSGDTGSAAIEAIKGRKRADIFILFPEGRVSPVQQRQMPDKAKAATARGAALGWAMQGAERWAGEIDLMELDSEEEPLDEIEKIMDSGGPELEELERALDGGVEGGNDAVPEEVGAGLLGEPEVCAEVKAVAYEPSMDELELVAELWQSTLSGWRSWRSRRS